MARPSRTDRGEARPAGERDNAEQADELRPPAVLFRDLRTSPSGLTSREAARRQLVHGPNGLTRSGGRCWTGELLSQFTQPLAILLALAAVLAWAGGTPALSVAVVAVILLNAAFAFVQETQAEKTRGGTGRVPAPTARVARDNSGQARRSASRRAVDQRGAGPGSAEVSGTASQVTAACVVPGN